MVLGIGNPAALASIEREVRTRFLLKVSVASLSGRAPQDQVALKLKLPITLTTRSFCFPTSSVILPLLASVRHSARSQCIANIVSNAVSVEQIFEAVGLTAFDEPRTRFQSAS